MNQPLTAEGLQERVREQQAETLSLLDELLNAPLPPASWIISDIVPTELSGQVAHPGRDDAAIRADMTRWSDFLGAEVTEEQHRRYVALRVRVQREGITVFVWAHVTAATGGDA